MSFQQYGRYDFGIQPIYLGYTPTFDMQADIPTYGPEMPASTSVGITDSDLNPTDIFNKMDSILSKAKIEAEDRNKGATYHEMYITHSSMLKSIKNAAVDPIKAATDMISKMNTYMLKHWKRIAPTAIKEYSNLLNGLDLDAVETKATPAQLESVEALKAAVKEGKSITTAWWQYAVVIGAPVVIFGSMFFLFTMNRGKSK